jgi:hypothetical protein
MISSGNIMTQIKIESPDGAAFGSTPNECGIAKVESAPTPFEVPRRNRKFRVITSVVAMLTVLCVGWGAGLKTHDSVDLAQASGWLRDTAGVLVSDLDRRRKQVLASVEFFATNSASQETISSDGTPDKTNSAEFIERAADDLRLRMDQLRTSSEVATRELGSVIEQLNGAVERSQRELLAKLDQIQEKLERIERHSATASIGSQAQPQEQSKGKPATNRAAISLQTTAPATGAKVAASSETTRIDDWVLRKVIDGTAILEGPSGLVGVLSGDVVPGLGRVESIVRRGGKWSVVTSKGVITAH